MFDENERVREYNILQTIEIENGGIDKSIRVTTAFVCFQKKRIWKKDYLCYAI